MSSRAHINAQRRARYTKDKTKRLAANSLYYQRHKERVLRKQREYYRKNRERVLANCAAYNKKNKDLIRLRRAEPSTREHRKAVLVEWRQSLRGRAKFMLSSARRRAQHIGVAFDLTLPWLLKRLEAGVCEMTGLPFDFTLTGDSRPSPRVPSLDRVKGARGYTKRNVKVVVWQLNAAKNAYGLEALDELAFALVRTRKTQELRRC